jgi:hypothetical protein
VVRVDIVEAVRHGKKRGVLNGCDEDGGTPGISILPFEADHCTADLLPS